MYGVVALISIGEAQPAAAAFPGDNGEIAFDDSNGELPEIYTMAADGSGLTNVTNDSTHDDLQPAWSADGTKIAFTSKRDGNYEIYTMSATGAGVTRLTNNAVYDDDPVWSPDGTKIAFRSFRDGNSELYSMNADGTGATRLTNNAATEIDPSWSPLGTSIAFSSNRDGDFEIFSMKSDGTGVTQLTKNTACDLRPNWSPDGRTIAFSDGAACTGPNEIDSMNTDGSGTVDLSNNSANDVDPAWSPDGTKIAFASNRDGDYEIYSMNADGSGALKLTTRTTSGQGKRDPDWQAIDGGSGNLQPDGRIRLSAQASYIGDDVYNLTGTNQTVTAKATTGSTKTWDITEQNDGDTTDTITVHGPGNKTGFTIHYFSGLTGTTDITSAVVNGTYELQNVAPGTTKALRVVIHVKSGLPIDTIRGWVVVATSTHDSTKQDAVKARVRVVAG